MLGISFENWLLTCGIFGLFFVFFFPIFPIAVDPVVQGKTRAEQFYNGDSEVGDGFCVCCVFKDVRNVTW